MKKMPKLPNVRNRELGAVAIVIAFAWTALFGMAVLAIDFGYLYAKRRGVQSVADAALRGSMPTWVQGYPSGLTAATILANNVTAANGYVNGSPGTTVTTTQDVANNLYTVSVSRTYPTFIGGVFGLSGKTVTGKATGQRTASGSGSAIHALNPNGGVCPGASSWGLGFQAEGMAPLIVNGDITSESQVFFNTTGGSVTGTIKSPCPLTAGVFNNSMPAVTINPPSAAGPWPATDPINATVTALGASCTPPMTIDNDLVASEIGWSNVGGAAGCDTFLDKVYCSNNLINISPLVSMSICPGTKGTFITRTNINVGANNAIDLQPATGAPQGILMAAYGNGGSAACGANTINMGTAGTYVLQGRVYAPNGCIWTAGAGAVGGFTMTGQIVGRNIAFGMSPGPAWTINGSGGGGGGSWTVYQ
jgi:hypothetical protein